MFYPLFHCGLQCRAVNISWFLFKDTIHVATKNWMDVFPRKRIGFANLALVSNSILTQLELQKGFGPIVLEFDDRHVCVKKSQQQWTKVKFAWIWATFSHVYPWLCREKNILFKIKKDFQWFKKLEQINIKCNSLFQGTSLVTHRAIQILIKIIILLLVAEGFYIPIICSN